MTEEEKNMDADELRNHEEAKRKLTEKFNSWNDKRPEMIRKTKVPTQRAANVARDAVASQLEYKANKNRDNDDWESKFDRNRG